MNLKLLEFLIDSIKQLFTLQGFMKSSLQNLPFGETFNMAEE